MGHVYREVKTLQGHTLVEGGDCVRLVKRFAPGLIGLPTSVWRAGKRVRDVAKTLEPGTAIATFEGGRYPQDGNTGKHAAFFVATAGAGFYVMDQWKNDPRKPMRHISPLGRNGNGTYKDPSNNADAFYVIEK
jgi:hypothetical protein